MKKFYVAFSVHSTNAFATATIETTDFVKSKDGKTITINGMDFEPVQSRRADYKESDGQKLHSKELLTKEGKPLRSTPMIARFFNKLERNGWTVNKDAFIQKHWRDKK